MRVGHKCSEFSPPVLKLGAHVAPLGMKFYTGSQFPAEYKNNIFIAEHGSWNRDKYRAAIASLCFDRSRRQEREGENVAPGLATTIEYYRRPADIQVAPDGSLLVSDD